MLTRTPGWQTTSGKHFTELKDAQADELIELFKPHDGALIADVIIGNADKVIDILTTTATSKVRARSINGGRKPRKSKATQTTEPTPTPHEHSL